VTTEHDCSCHEISGSASRLVPRDNEVRSHVIVFVSIRSVSFPFTRHCHFGHCRWRGTRLARPQSDRGIHHCTDRRRGWHLLSTSREPRVRQGFHVSVMEFCWVDATWHPPPRPAQLARSRPLPWHCRSDPRLRPHRIARTTTFLPLTAQGTTTNCMCIRWFHRKRSSGTRKSPCRRSRTEHCLLRY
jgi:hypothetical protein